MSPDPAVRRAENTASARLERILYILPAAARAEGVRLEELARALGVEAGVVLRDLEHVTSRAYYHPAGAVESFSIIIDGRSVHVYAPHEFQRPVRLNRREALALGLGLRTLAADADPQRRREILELAQRLEMELSTPEIPTVQHMREVGMQRPSAATDQVSFDIEAALPPPAVERVDAAAPRPPDIESDVDFEEYALAFDDDGFRGIVADAIEFGRLCTIWYLKPGDVAPAYRTIAPYRLVHARGKWYVAAYDTDREALRFFRLDRVLNAALEDDVAPPLPQYQLNDFLTSGAPYAAGDDIEVSVRYSPHIARWITERTASHTELDGSVVLTHRVADPRWIVRHVLQYGGEAVVERPGAAREWVAAAARLADPAPDV